MATIDFVGDDRFKCGATNRMAFGFANLTDPEDTSSPLIPDADYLVGATARMQARWKTTDPEPLFEATTENGKITLDVANGRVDIIIPPGDTELITLREKMGVYDLEIVLPSGDVDRPCEGSILFDPNVTRPAVA